MRWGEFKRWVEEAGVTDDMEMLYVEFGDHPPHVGINDERTEFGVW